MTSTMVTVGNSLPSEEAHFENLVDQVVKESS
jgi:hypothetical protein